MLKSDSSQFLIVRLCYMLETVQQQETKLKGPIDMFTTANSTSDGAKRYHFIQHGAWTFCSNALLGAESAVQLSCSEIFFANICQLGAIRETNDLFEGTRKHINEGYMQILCNGPNMH